jgi:uncharacterized protein YeaO (DUF488 family)
VTVQAGAINREIANGAPFAARMVGGRPAESANRRAIGEPMLKLKRAYDPASRTDGKRFLIERLWPRGLSKLKLHVDAWLKEAGPSTALRKWFSHDPSKWLRFRTRYFRELDARPEAWQPILSAARRGTVTLVYSSHDTEHNNAVALQEYLQAKIRTRMVGRSVPDRPRRFSR